MDGPATERLHGAIANWIKALDDYPGWREWNRRKIGKVLDYDDPWPDRSAKPPLGDFEFDPETERQHSIALGFIQLHHTALTLRDCEYYFRRYPFRGLPVTPYDHINNVCEMYFGRFYEFKSRLKNFLNLMNKNTKSSLPVGPFLKMFDKAFEQELRARNDIHHRERFSDLSIDNVALTYLVSSGEGALEHLRQRSMASYRRASREWAGRAKERSRKVGEFVEATAVAVLENCSFLSTLSTEKAAQETKADS